MIEHPFPRLLLPPPIAKLYEPSLDEDDDDPPETSRDVEDFGSSCSIDEHAFDSVANYAAFLVCVSIGGVIAGVLWWLVNLFVPL